MERIHPEHSTVQGAVLWGMRILVAAIFLYASSRKLSGRLVMVDMFDQVGLGQWFRILTGLVGLSGAILTFVPVTSLAGLMTPLAVDIDSFIAQLTVLHGDIVHTIVLVAAILLAAWLGRPRVLGGMPA